MFNFDVAFAIGGKSADRDLLLQQQKQMIYNFLDSYRFPIEMNNIRLAFLTYGDGVKIVKNLDQNFVLPYVRRYLDDMAIGGSKAYIEQALEGAAASIFPKARPGVQKVLVLFADDSSDSNINAIRQAKQELNDQNVQVVLIGSGNRVKMSAAAAIASNSGDIVTGLTSKTFIQSYRHLMKSIIDGKRLSMFCFNCQCSFIKQSLNQHPPITINYFIKRET